MAKKKKATKKKVVKTVVKKTVSTKRVSKSRVTKKVAPAKPPYRKANTVISIVEALFRGKPSISIVEMIKRVKAKKPKSKINNGAVAYYASIMREKPYSIKIPIKPTVKDGILPKKDSNKKSPVTKTSKKKPVVKNVRKPKATKKKKVIRPKKKR